MGGKTCFEGLATASQPCKFFSQSATKVVASRLAGQNDRLASRLECLAAARGSSTIAAGSRLKMPE